MDPSTIVVLGSRLSTITANAPIESIVEKMIVLQVRCLFVTDSAGVLIGTISVFDATMKKQTNNKAIRSFVILSQLVGMFDRSLAYYLVNARPWRRRPYLLLGAIARRLDIEHEHYAGEITRLLHARGHNVNSHTYPMEFTYYNNLSLEYLAPQLVDHQHRLISFANATSKGLMGDYEAERILRKLLDSLRKYGFLLEELLAPHRLAPPTSGQDRAASKLADSAPDRTKGRNARSMESQTAA